MSPLERSLAERAQALQHAALAEATHKTYARCWKEFTDWCAQAHRSPLPAAQLTVIGYLSSASARVGETAIDQRAAAIRRAHLQAGYPNPCRTAAVRQLRYGIRVERPRSLERKAAMAIQALRELIETIPRDVRGKRDRAIFLIGWAGGLGSTRLAALCVERTHLANDELRIVEDGVQTIIQPAQKYSELDPVAAYRDWVAVAHLCSGALFRPIRKNGAVVTASLRPDSFAWILKARCEAAGFGPKEYGVRSLRDGLLSESTASAHRLLAHLRLSDLHVLRKKVKRLRWSRPCAS